ncbi:MAG TPA: tetraacyldisaccharide 4'-kinase [Tepidisphaeraceae bacterium]|nr:tetraacyldisaccharide 4'-kinase [Tepidisphaeraceae bacterium]
MGETLEQCHRNIISGARQSAAASMMRGLLSAIEPLYVSITSLRNELFERDILTVSRAPRPVISIGNITTGGTGKTPVVRWLTESLIASGKRPAVLLRGYRGGDEQRMLQSQVPSLIVQANPSRVEGVRQVLGKQPQVDLFVMDDGFQHRKLARDFDLVLIDATNPFGFERVLPRGLLREPLDGLSRATAFLITRSDMADGSDIESTLRKYNPQAPIYRSRHVQTGLRSSGGSTMSLSDLRDRRVMTFCGIASPANFEKQLAATGANLVAREVFSDHHLYNHQDLANLLNRAQSTGAEFIVTTEKDWVKIQPLGDDEIWRVELRIEFVGDDEARLLDQIKTVIESSSKS